MRVFIHLNHGTDKSYLLAFPKAVTAKELKKILNDDYDKAVHLLLAKAEEGVAVLPKYRSKARMLADFVLMEGYASERLA